MEHPLGTNGREIPWSLLSVNEVIFERAWPPGYRGKQCCALNGLPRIVNKNE